MLDKAHSQFMYQKIKELRPKGNRGLQTIKSKQVNVLMEKDEVRERWAEYVEELYKVENRGVDQWRINFSMRPRKKFLCAPCPSPEIKMTFFCFFLLISS